MVRREGERWKKKTITNETSRMTAASCEDEALRNPSCAWRREITLDRKGKQLMQVETKKQHMNKCAWVLIFKRIVGA
jgi:hypothetical protein